MSVPQWCQTRYKSDTRCAASGNAFLCRRKERGLTLLKRLVLFEFIWQIFHIIKLVSHFIFQHFFGGRKYFFEATWYTRYHFFYRGQKNLWSKWPLFLSLFNWKKCILHGRTGICGYISLVLRAVLQIINEDTSTILQCLWKLFQHLSPCIITKHHLFLQMEMWFDSC